MANNTIKIKSYLDVQEEYIAGAAITPGHLVKVNSAGKVVVMDTASGTVLPMFAVEDEHRGKTISDAYAANDPVQCWIPNRGDIVNALLAVGENVAIGDFLEPKDDGTLRKLITGSGATDGGAVVGVAIEAVNLTGSGAVTSRIKVRIK